MRIENTTPYLPVKMCDYSSNIYYFLREVVGFRPSHADRIRLYGFGTINALLSKNIANDLLSDTFYREKSIL